MDRYLVYLAGPIAGLTFDESEDWRERFTASLPAEIITMSPMRGKAGYLRSRGILGDNYDGDPICTDDAIFMRDKNDCLRADAVVVNLLGSRRVSIGTMFEIAWAHLAGVPTVVIMEPAGNIHEHCFVRKAAGVRVATLEEAAEVVRNVLIPDQHWTARE